MFKFILGFITSQARVSTERKFREKMRKFSVAFRKLFREISHFFAFRNKAKFSGKRNAKMKQNGRQKFFI